MTTNQRAATRRAPRQERSKNTVGVVLDAVVRVLRSHGVEGVTTNRIAEAAGVSIGSVYQYFPDKRSIYAALHNRHVEEVGQVIEATLAQHSGEAAISVLVERLLDVHLKDPELHRIISNEIPENSQGFQNALRSSLEKLLPADARLLFVLPGLIETLVHGAVDRRPATLSLADARSEVMRTVAVYLASTQR